MIVDILGTPYEYIVTTEKEDAALIGHDGYCDNYAKRIVLEGDYTEIDPLSTKDIGAHKQKVQRHELVHAFLFESGLTDLCSNEQLVDWIACQFPKMLEAFKKMGAI